MYSKSYHDLLKPLRSREPRPSFARIAKLVATAPTRKPAAIPLFAKFLVGIILGGAIATGIFLQSRVDTIKLAAQVNHPKATQFISNKSRRDAKAIDGDTFGKLSAGFSHRVATKRMSIGSRKDGTIADNSYRPFGTHPDSASTTPATHVANSSSIVPSGLKDTAPIAIPDSESQNPHHFFATVGGAIAQQFSSNSLFRQFSFSDAFAGVGYNLSQNSSVRVLGGEEVFALSQNSYYVTYHDTTFYHNGTPYPNIIGQVNPTAGSALTPVYWLGASYRYTFAGGSVHPFAEVMAGGSSDGVITHQSIGAELSITDNLGLDLLLHADELLPQNSVWLTKAGFAAALSYAW